MGCRLVAVATHIETATRAAFYLNIKMQSASAASKSSKSVLLALGSNLGSRTRHLNGAIKRLQQSVGDVVDTSFLYETRPAYVTEQPSFLNAACRVITDLPPAQLLDQVKRIERELGRVQTYRNGPRVIDVDVLTYGTERISIESPLPLEVPHPRIGERDFVLRPLCDMVPSAQLPSTSHSFATLLARLPVDPAMRRVLSFSRNESDLLWRWGERTFVMGIVNVTPDSFSDGGEHFSLDAAVACAKKMVASKVDILDIGGMSTRPGAAAVSESDELARILPIIKALRQDETMKHIPISVDTQSSMVAKACIEAGADLINDVSGGLSDVNMLPTVAALNVPYCIMHMRGSPSTMQQPPHIVYERGVTQTVKVELGLRVEAALKAGVKRWNIIVDPGIGFAKTFEHNIELLRSLPSLCQIHSFIGDSVHSDAAVAQNQLGFPLLMGTSRKAFVGRLLRRSPNDPASAPAPRDRVHGSCAAAVISAQGGASVVRVHDVAETVDALRVADAVYRSL